MRHHFHRCGNLRVLTLEARDLSHARRGGAQVLEELCEARRLAPCVGLVECDVLSPAQKRDLLVARVTPTGARERGDVLLAKAITRTIRSRVGPVPEVRHSNGGSK